MPIAVHFEGANQTHVHEDCFDLPTMVLNLPFGERKVPHVTSCWQLSDEELDAFKANGNRIFITVTGGQPPMSVSLEPPKEEIIVVEYIDIAKRLKEQLETSVRIVHHGTEGRVYLTFADMQFDLSKEEWQHVQDLYADLP